MLKQDAIQITVMPDGLIKVVTDPISGANHVNAEQFLQLMAKLAGGETTVTSKGKSLTHSHHIHEHETEGGRL